jgi:hypothetical protein
VPPKKLKLPKPAHFLSVEYGKFKLTGQGLGVVAVMVIFLGLFLMGKLVWPF